MIQQGFRKPHFKVALPIHWPKHCYKRWTHGSQLADSTGHPVSGNHLKLADDTAVGLTYIIAADITLFIWAAVKVDFRSPRSGEYAMEEMVAELGAAFLCGDLGITAEPRSDHAAYIDHWLPILKEDRKDIFTASSAANKAAEYLALFGNRELWEAA